MRNSKFVGILSLVALACASVANAGSILFDPDGTGASVGAQTIDKFDWSTGNGLAVGGVDAINTFIASNGTTKTPFELFFQQRLSAASFNNLNINLGAGQITAVGAITERVKNAIAIDAGSGFATFELAPVQTANYFEMWYDPTPDADSLTGTGFNGYAGVPAGGANGVDTNLGLAADSDAKLILSGTIGVSTLSTFFSEELGADLDTVGDNNYPGVKSRTGDGGADLELDVTAISWDSDFFPFLEKFLKFNFSTDLTTPFITDDPAARFLTTSTTTSVGVVPTVAGAGSGSIGAVNGTTGPDFQIEIDGSSVVSGQLVPEPSSFAVFALLAVGVLGRRRRDGNIS